MLLEFVVLLCSFPLGRLLAKITRDEKGLYSLKQYFPLLLWVLAFLSAVYLTLNPPVGISFLFSFLTIFTWYHT